MKRLPLHACVCGPPEVMDLALNLGRVVGSRSDAEVLGALLEVAAWRIADSLREADAIDPFVDLWARQLKARAHTIHARHHRRSDAPARS